MLNMYISRALVWDTDNMEKWFECAENLGWQRPVIPFRDGDELLEWKDRYLEEKFGKTHRHRLHFLYSHYGDVKYFKRLLDLLLESKTDDHRVVYQIHRYLKKIFTHPNLSREENYSYFVRFIDATETVLYVHNMDTIFEWLVYLLKEQDGFRIIDSDLWHRLASLKSLGDRETLLHLACRLNFRKKNDVSLTFVCDLVRTLLRKGADVNATSLYDMTPLHFAFYIRERDAMERVCRILIEEHGAHLDMSKWDGRSMFPDLCRTFPWIPKVLSLKCLSARKVTDHLVVDPRKLEDTVPAQLISFLEVHGNPMMK